MKNLKPSKTAVEKATNAVKQKRAVQVFSTTAHGEPKYVGILDKSTGAFAGLTVAALIVSNFITMTKAGVVAHAKGAKPDPDKFGEITEARSYWMGAGGLMTETGLTEKGLANVAARLEGTHKSGCNTTVNVVTQFVAAITKGGTVKAGDKEYVIASPHTL